MEKKRGRDKFNRYKQAIIFISKVVSFLPFKLQLTLFNIFRNVNGTVGIGIRYIFLKNITKNCGDNVSIHRGVYLFSPQNLSIGDNVSIHPMSYIDAAGKVVIEDNVSIAHSSTILSSTHTYEERNIAIKDQPINFKETHIHENVWIGCKATILNGITINSGSIVGACSLVTRDVPENVIVGGVPAKIIKIREN